MPRAAARSASARLTVNARRATKLAHHQLGVLLIDLPAPRAHRRSKLRGKARTIVSSPAGSEQPTVSQPGTNSQMGCKPIATPEWPSVSTITWSTYQPFAHFGYFSNQGRTYYRLYGAWAPMRKAERRLSFKLSTQRAALSARNALEIMSFRRFSRRCATQQSLTDIAYFGLSVRRLPSLFTLDHRVPAPSRSTYRCRSAPHG